MFLTSRAFWVYAGDRAVKSFGQSVLGSNVIDSTGLVDFHGVPGILATAAAYTVMSFLTALVAWPSAVPVPNWTDPPADLPINTPPGTDEGVENQKYFRAIAADIQADPDGPLTGEIPRVSADEVDTR